MKVTVNKEFDVKRCSQCPYCKVERTMEGLYATCDKLVDEDGEHPFIGGWGHTIYECIDKRCPLKKICNG